MLCCSIPLDDDDDAAAAAAADDDDDDDVDQILLQMLYMKAKTSTLVHSKLLIV